MASSITSSRLKIFFIITILAIIIIPSSDAQQPSDEPNPFSAQQYAPSCTQSEQTSESLDTSNPVYRGSSCQRCFNEGFRAGLHTGLRIRVEGAEWLLNELENTSCPDNSNGDAPEEPEPAPRWFDDYPEEETSRNETSPETEEPRWFYEYNITPDEDE